MNYKLIGATAVRVLAQLRRDPRSIAMILVLPALLLTAVYFLFENEKLPPGAPRSFDRIGLIMLAVFPFVVMFLVTSITMLRERTSGTLERLMTTPIHKADLVLGYAVAFSVMAALQSVVATGIAYWCFGLNVAGSAGLVVLLAVLNAILGVFAGLTLLSLRPHRVSGGAIHATCGDPAVIALRSVRGQGSDERGTARLGQGDAAELLGGSPGGSGTA